MGTLLIYYYLETQTAMIDSANFISWICPLSVSLCLMELVGSCIIFHQHLVAFTGSALLWGYTD